jgi:diguanylate cyclase (GGDEF)-like protein
MATRRRLEGGGHVHLVEDACEELRRATNAERASVWVLDERGLAVSPLVSVGSRVPRPNVARRWSRFPLARIGPFADAIAGGAPVRVDDVASVDVPAELISDFEISSVWVAPLTLGGQALGVVALEPATAGDVAEAVKYVEPVAQPLSAARAWYVADRREAELDMLLELTQATAASVPGGGAIAHLCQRLAAQVGVRRTCVFLVVDGQLVTAEAHYADGRVDPDAFRAFTSAPDAPAIVVEAFRRWQTVVVDDAASDLLGDWGQRFDIGSGVAVPIGTQHEPLGVLTLDDAQERRFTPQVIDLAEAAAAHFSVLYERARLLDEQARGLRAGAAVRRLLREGAGATTAGEAVDVVARVGLEALEAEHACAFVFDDSGAIEHLITVGVTASSDAVMRQRFLGLRLSDVPLGRYVVDERRPVLVDDAGRSDLLPAELLDELYIRSYVAIPLDAGGRLRGGVLFSTSTHRRHWSQADRHLVEQLVLECDLIMENTVLREAEAARIADLAHLALHDPLTGLPNRALLDDRLDAALRGIVRTGGEVAVLFVDLRRFKAVNDRFGHEVGDAVLAQLGSRFCSVVRPSDTVGRLAGDEFLVVLSDATEEAACGVAQRLSDAAEEAIEVDGVPVHVGASVGVAIGGAEVTAKELIHRADMAMYDVKRTTGSGWALASASSTERGAVG